MRRVFWTVIIIFCFILSAPLLQMQFHIVEPAKLAGVVAETARPFLTLRSLRNRSFQDQFDAWFKQHMGLREWMITSDNQINFWLFRESRLKADDAPIIGKDNFLYARAYVDSCNLRRVRLANPEEFASKLRRLQDALALKNIAFLLLISPNKAEIYPEYIPSGYILSSGCDNPSDYQRLLPFLNKYGVNVVDGHRIFTEEKQKTTYLLFPPGGIHWNGRARILLKTKYRTVCRPRWGRTS